MARMAQPPAPKMTNRKGKFSFPTLDDSGSDPGSNSGNSKSPQDSDKKSSKSGSEYSNYSQEKPNFSQTLRQPLSFGKEETKQSSFKAGGPPKFGLNIDLSHEESSFKTIRNKPSVGFLGQRGGLNFKDESDD